MNPGPVEEAGATARSVVDNLASTPVVLALVVFNVLYLAFGFWERIKDAENRTELLQTWASEHKNTMDLIARCALAGGMKLQSDESHPVTLPPIQPLPKD